MIARCDENGLRADNRDIVEVAGEHAGDNRCDVIRMYRKEAVDRRASNTHQPRLAARRRLLGQPIEMPRFKGDRIDLVAAKRLILFGGPELLLCVDDRCLFRYCRGNPQAKSKRAPGWNAGPPR